MILLEDAVAKNHTRHVTDNPCTVQPFCFHMVQDLGQQLVVFKEVCQEDAVAIHEMEGLDFGGIDKLDRLGETQGLAPLLRVAVVREHAVKSVGEGVAEPEGVEDLIAVVVQFLNALSDLLLVEGDEGLLLSQLLH